MEFKYIAVYQNKTVEGFIEAKDKQEAIKKLKEQDLIVLHIEQKEIKVKKIDFSFLEKFSRDLFQLLKAGLSVDKALILVAESERKHRNALLKAYEEIKKGNPIYLALEETGIFPRDYVELIRAGEESGNLIETFELINNFLHELNEFRKNLISSLTYPAFLIVVTFLSLTILSAYVIPKFKILFESTNAEIPLITKFVFLLSDYFNVLIVVSTVFLFLLLIFINILRKNENLRNKIERILIKVPIIGKLVLQYDLIKIANSMYTLLKGGISLDKALEIAVNVPSLKILRNHINDVLSKVIYGEKLSEALKQKELIPETVIEILKVGEESGELAGAWFQVYITLSDDFKTFIRSIINFIEPVILLITGLFIGFIVFGIIVGVFTISGTV